MKVTTRLLGTDIRRYSQVEFITHVNDDFSASACAVKGLIEFQRQEVQINEIVTTEFADEKYATRQCDIIHALVRSALNQFNAKLALHGGLLNETEITLEIDDPIESYKCLHDIIAEGKGCSPFKEAFINDKFISIYRAEGWSRQPYIVSIIDTQVGDIESLDYKVEKYAFEKVEFLYGATWENALDLYKQYIQEQMELLD